MCKFNLVFFLIKIVGLRRWNIFLIGLGVRVVWGVDDICFCFGNFVGREGYRFYSIYTSFFFLYIFVKLNLAGVFFKGKENFRVWLGKVKSCLFWGIIYVNNSGIVFVLDVSNWNDWNGNENMCFWWLGDEKRNN